MGPTKISPYLEEQIPSLTESFDFVFSWTLSSPPSHESQIGNDRVEEDYVFVHLRKETDIM